MYQHVVCFKFKGQTSETAIQKHMDDFAALKHAIPEVMFYEAGRVFHSNQAAKAYDSVHYLTFSSKDDMEIYDQHDAHQRFIAENRDTWDAVLVLDTEIEA